MTPLRGAFVAASALRAFARAVWRVGRRRAPCEYLAMRSGSRRYPRMQPANAIHTGACEACLGALAFAALRAISLASPFSMGVCMDRVRCGGLEHGLAQPHRLPSRSHSYTRRGIHDTGVLWILPRGAQEPTTRRQRPIHGLGLKAHVRTGGRTRTVVHRGEMLPVGPD